MPQSIRQLLLLIFAFLWGCGAKNFGKSEGNFCSPRTKSSLPRCSTSVPIADTSTKVLINKQPDWVQGAVIYELYPRSFSKQATLNQVAYYLPTLKELGITVLWLMPIHPIGNQKRIGDLGSPYSVQNYYEIDPSLGSKEDLFDLIYKAHLLGLKVILDLVINHTAWDNPLIYEFPSWYIKDKGGDIISPNPYWTDVAALNYQATALWAYMIDMMLYWVREFDIDGFRADAASFIPLDFWEEAKDEIYKIKPIFMLAEGDNADYMVKAFHASYSWKTYDSLKEIIIHQAPATLLTNVLIDEYNTFPSNSLFLRFNSNHDKHIEDGTPRQVFGERGTFLTALLTYTLPGIPLIYNGDEVENNNSLSLFNKAIINWEHVSPIKSFYLQLGKLRQEHTSLRYGKFQILESQQQDSLYIFTRSDSKETVIIAINFSSSPQQTSIIAPDDLGNQVACFFSKKTLEVKEKVLSFSLPAMGYEVFYKINRLKSSLPKIGAKRS